MTAATVTDYVYYYPRGQQWKKKTNGQTLPCGADIAL